MEIFGDFAPEPPNYTCVGCENNQPGGGVGLVVLGGR